MFGIAATSCKRVARRKYRSASKALSFFSRFNVMMAIFPRVSRVTSFSAIAQDNGINQSLFYDVAIIGDAQDMESRELKVYKGLFKYLGRPVPSPTARFEPRMS